MINNWADVFPPRPAPTRPSLERSHPRPGPGVRAKARQPVNMIAVDIYDLGGLVAAVDELKPSGWPTSSATAKAEAPPAA